jgi:hypothetical protein
MTPVLKKYGKVVQIAAQAGIGRELKARYGKLANGPLPSTFTALLARLESVELIARNVARVERLRRGLKVRKKYGVAIAVPVSLFGNLYTPAVGKEPLAPRCSKLARSVECDGRPTSDGLQRATRPLGPPNRLDEPNGRVLGIPVRRSRRPPEKD